VPTFRAYDGTELAYHVFGAGDPLVCLPGGPMQDSAYLGELGGLSAHRQLVRLDLRGTGDSAIPEDVASCRCDRQIDDVEALREHLGLDRIALLGHSAGANLAVLYAARHPGRINRLALITPSTYAVGIQPTGEMRREHARLRSDEPWFPTAYAALEDLSYGRGTPGSREAIIPFFYGRWDAAAQAHQAAEAEQQHPELAEAYFADGAFDPDSTRAVLATLEAPVLFVAGELDLGAIPSVVAEYAALPPNAVYVVQPHAGHFPWLDDAETFVATTATFLA
jgi:pimeloyl-ACP methyl ester carboxylesterase